jgi:hypothetical protein
MLMVMELKTVLMIVHSPLGLRPLTVKDVLTPMLMGIPTPHSIGVLRMVQMLSSTKLPNGETKMVMDTAITMNSGTTTLMAVQFSLVLLQVTALGALTPIQIHFHLPIWDGRHWTERTVVQVYMDHQVETEMVALMKMEIPTATLTQAVATVQFGLFPMALMRSLETIRNGRMTMVMDSETIPLLPP